MTIDPHDSRDSIDAVRLGRYVSGECTPQERGEIEQWLDAAPGRRAQADELRTVWQLASEPAEVWDTGAVANRIIARSLGPDALPPERTHVRTSPRLGAWWTARRRSISPFQVAAGVLILAGAYYAIQGRRGPTNPAPTIHQERPVRDVVTGRGERARIVLADDTEIRLAPASRLRIPLYDTGATRELFLDGAARFTVTHDTARPFIVRTSRAVVRDVGTVFGVRAYAGMPTADIAVLEGAVAISHDASSRLSTPLHRGDLARVTTTGAITTTHDANVETFVNGIIARRLVFEGATLAEVIAQMEREFDVDIRVASTSLSSTRIRATFSDQSLSEAIEQLSTLLGATHMREGRTITLRARPAVRPAVEPEKMP